MTHAHRSVKCICGNVLLQCRCIEGSRNFEVVSPCKCKEPMKPTAVPEGWKVKKAEPYWFEIKTDDALVAVVRFDGCVHLNSYFNGTTEEDTEPDTDYMHICDLPAFIGQLQKIYTLAKEHYDRQGTGDSL